MSTATAAASSKALNKKELKKFQELLGREAQGGARARPSRCSPIENMTLDTNDLPDEMDLASSEYLQSFEFRLRGREKSLLNKLDLALKKIDEGTFGVCEICDGADRQEAPRGATGNHALYQVQRGSGARRTNDGLRGFSR